MKNWLEPLIVVGLVGFDQGLKFSIIFFNFSYSFFGIGEFGIWRNAGGVFSVELPSWFILVMSLLALIFITYGWYYYASIRGEGHSLIRLGLVFLLSGGISNLWDRLHAGAVIDYISFYNLHINVSDIYILTGSMMVIIYLVGAKDRSITA